jgi:hypothetical protein
MKSHVIATIRIRDYNKKKSMKAMKENSTTHGNYDVAIVSMETHASMNGT